MATRVQHASVLPILGTLVLIIACLYWAKAVLIPIALAILLTSLLNPVVSALHGLRLPRTPAVLVVVVLLFSLVGGVAWTVARQLTMLAYDIPRYQENVKQKINDLRQVGKNGVIERVLTTIKELTAELQRDSQLPSEPQPGGKPKAGPSEEPGKPVPVVIQTPSVFWQLPSVLDSLATAGLVVVLVIFMLVRHGDLRGRMLYRAGYHRLTTATKALDDLRETQNQISQLSQLVSTTTSLSTPPSGKIPLRGAQP